MSKIPCKICNSCGFYHDLSVTVCDKCGTDLKNIPALMTETEEIPNEKHGKIDISVPVFVQKCSVCGTLNFTADKELRVQICRNCHKRRVAAVEPERYTEPSEEACDDGAKDNNTQGDGTAVSDSDTANAGSSRTDGMPQFQDILGNVKKSVEGAESNPASAPPAAPLDDDAPVLGWSEILDVSSATQKAAADEHKPAITLTAVRYGCLSFTVEAKDGEYLLGRSAKQSEFLRNDIRVGNEHCYIHFKDGAWYVKDNHSSNGTAVNSQDIGYNGEHVLNNADELKLGHHPDSMAFKITIK